MIESGFLTNARSHVLATGMWQFMDPTARAYGLHIDGYVDERRDPVRATDAAHKRSIARLGDRHVAVHGSHGESVRVAHRRLRG